MTFQILSDKIRQCQRCGLYRGIREYVPGIVGTKYPGLVVVGEAPGALEDIAGEPFVGQSGKILDICMAAFVGVERGEYTILNSVKCRPPQNRDPTDREKRACRPWLLEQLRLIKPTTIVTLGVHGAHAILGEKLPLRELRENYYTLDNHDCDVYPTYHPMATVYMSDRRKEFEADLRLIRDRNYRGVRFRDRCSLSLDAPQSPHSGGIALP